MSVALQAVVSLNRTQFDSGLIGMRQLVGDACGAMAMAFAGVGGEIYAMTRAFGGVGAIVGILREATEVGSQFEQQMANVASVTGITGAELENLGRRAAEFATTTSYTAGQAAEALYALGSAGFATSQDLMNLLVPSLQLAGATQSETKMATESLTATLQAFRLESSEATRVANLFAGAIAASPLTMERLSFALSESLPIAAGFGMTVDQLVDSLAAFHMVGIRGSEAGTRFRQAMIELNQEMVAAESSIGRALQGWNPALEGLTGAIRRLEQAGIGGAEAIRILGVRGGAAVSALLALGSAEMEQVSQRIRTMGDVAGMFATQMNTVHSQWERFISMLTNVGIGIFDLIKDTIRSVIAALQDFAQWLTRLIEAINTVGSEPGGGLIRFGDQTVQVTNEVRGRWDALITFLSDTWTQVSNYLVEKLTQAVNTILGLIAAIDWIAVWRALKEAFVWAANLILYAANELVRWLRDQIQGLSARDLWNGFVDTAGWAWNEVKNIVDRLAPQIRTLATNIFGAVSDAARLAVDLVNESMSSINFDAIQNEADQTGQAVSQALGQPLSQFINDMATATSRIDWPRIGYNIVEGLSTALQQAQDFIRGFIRNQTTQDVVQAIGRMAGALIRGVIELVWTIMGGLSAEKDTIVARFAGLIGEIVVGIFMIVKSLLVGLLRGLFGEELTAVMGPVISLFFSQIRLWILEHLAPITDTIMQYMMRLVARITGVAGDILAALGFDELSTKVTETGNRIMSSTDEVKASTARSIALTKEEIDQLKVKLSSLAQSTQDTAGTTGTSMGQIKDSTNDAGQAFQNLTIGTRTPEEIEQLRIKVDAVRTVTDQIQPAADNAAEAMGRFQTAIQNAMEAVRPLADLVAGLQGLGNMDTFGPLQRISQAFNVPAMDQIASQLPSIARSLEILASLRGVCWATD